MLPILTKGANSFRSLVVNLLEMFYSTESVIKL